MLIKKISIHEIVSDYAKFYKDIFNEIDIFQSPAFVYVICENRACYQRDEYVGFMSGYEHNLSTVYLQYAGVAKQFRGYKTLKLFKEAIEFIHKEYQFIMIWINNENVVALKIALSGGFKIIGTRMATDKSLYIELLREL